MSGIDIISAIASAALGALAGSLSAFWLGRFQQKRDILNKEHSALLSAQYALMSQWTVLEDIRKDLLEPNRDDPERQLHLPIYQKFGAVLRVDFTSISFICCSNNPDLLQQVHLAEQNFDTAHGALETRNLLCEKFFSEGNIKEFDSETGEAKISAPKSDAFMLKQSTDNLYRCVDQALPKLISEIDSLGAFVKGRFKNRKALSMAPKNAV